MDRISFLAVFFIVCVVADVSDAASSLSKRRILIGEPQTDNKTVPGKGKEDSLVPSPLLPPTVSSSGGSRSDNKPVDDPSKEKTPKPKVDQGPKVGLNNDTKKSEGKDAETEKKDPEHARTSNEDPKLDTDKMSKDNPKEDTDKVSKDNPKEKDNPNAKEKKDTPKQKQESCAGVTKIKTCAVKDVAVACIKSFSSGSKEVGILVQNLRNSTSKATLSTNGTSKDLEIPKQQNRKVNISIDPGKRTNITLNAGTGECKLHIDPLPLAFLSLKTIATPSVEFKDQRLK